MESGLHKNLLPCNFASFKAQYQQLAHSPEGALRMYFIAVFAYINESTRSEASKMLRYALHLEYPLENSANHTTFLQRLRDPTEQHIFRSFAAGSSPENGYQVTADFHLAIEGVVKESDYTRILLRSSGADNARSVWVKQFDGLWYTINNASTYAQVRAPRALAPQKTQAHDADH